MLDLGRISCLGEALRDATVTYKANVALIEADRHRENLRVDYRELRREAERFGSRLQGAGVEPGDRCAILMSNQARWIMTGLSVLWSGGVLVPLDYKLTASEQVALLRHARPKVLVTEYGILRSLIEVGQDTLEDLRVFVTEAPKEGELHGAARWEDAAPAPFRYVERTRQDVASIVYSSGTGGTPKGCMLTHENYLEQAQVLGRMYPMVEGDVYFSVLPTNHAIDFMCGMIIPFLFGATVLHQRTLRPEFLGPTMRSYRVTHTALVPRILKALKQRVEEQLAELPEWKRSAVHALIQLNDLATMRDAKPRLSRVLLRPIHERFGGHLRLIFAGGAFVEPELAEYFYRLGLPVVIGYGLTEACTVLTLNDLAPFRSDTAGRPVAGVELELRNQGADGVGEVWARSNTLMRGYFEAPELSAETLVGGWLRTGDLGTIDASGHLRLVGRAKNMIVTEGGKNVYPEDVEAAFATVRCEELCVLAEGFVWPKPGLGADTLVVVVRLGESAGAQGVLDELRACNLGLAEYKRVRSFVLHTAEFPRTASMKVKRDLLAQELRARHAAPEKLS